MTLNFLKKAVVFGALMMVGSQISFAGGDSGCGLGGMIISKNTKVSQTLAVTTNGTLSNQLFGITSGTSNCSANGLVLQEHEAVIYAEANLQSLKVDFARGQGESMTAMAELVGCQGDAAIPFGAAAKAQYSTLFSTTDASGLVKNLAAVCQASKG